HIRQSLRRFACLKIGPRAAVVERGVGWPQVNPTGEIGNGEIEVASGLVSAGANTVVIRVFRRQRDRLGVILRSEAESAQRVIGLSAIAHKQSAVWIELNGLLIVRQSEFELALGFFIVFQSEGELAFPSVGNRAIAAIRCIIWAEFDRLVEVKESLVAIIF